MFSLLYNNPSNGQMIVIPMGSACLILFFTRFEPFIFQLLSNSSNNFCHQFIIGTKSLGLKWSPMGKHICNIFLLKKKILYSEAWDVINIILKLNHTSKSATLISCKKC